MIRKSLPLLALLLLPVAAAAQQPTAVPCAAPGVTFASLLDNVHVGYGDGLLSIDSLYAVCLPQPARQSTSNYAYDPDTGGKLTTQVKRADGTLLNTFVWYAESIGGLWQLSRYKVVGGYESVKPLTAGNYLLEFAADDRVFYRFPFTVSEGRADDPYAPAGTRYFIEGAWNDYGNLYYQRNDPASSLSFTIWLQEKSGNDKGRQGVPYEMKLVRERDGQTLAVDSGTLHTEPRWLKLQSSFKPAGGDANSYYRAGDLLREDGAYSFRFTLDGKPQGRYPFTVKGGRVQVQGAQVREKTDPLTLVVDYVGGGRYTSWWLKREGAAR